MNGGQSKKNDNHNILIYNKINAKGRFFLSQL